MVSSLMLIVVERRQTFHYYYPMGVHPPGDLTVTVLQAHHENNAYCVRIKSVLLMLL